MLNQPKTTYIEPFAGGAGVALSLLLNGIVDRIVINDYDKAIYSFWRALKESPQELIELVLHTPLTIDEWKKQKSIYSTQNKRYSIELGFSAFYLNRTNRSGILNAGPIGGYEQKGHYTMEARFNRDTLAQRIQDIAAHKNQIMVYNKEIRSFIRGVIPRYMEDAFIYFDPPYYVNGQRLYKNFLSEADHSDIASCIIEEIDCPWIITYDDVPELKKIYVGFPQKRYTLNYSAANKGQGTELIIFKTSELVPPAEFIQEYMGNFQLI